jgi:succinoglycan biosynthesis transport protein ExoP
MYELTGGTSPKQSDALPEGFEWGSLLRILSRRRRAFFAIFAAFVAVVALLTIATPKQYTTAVQMIAGNPSSASGDLSQQTNLPILNALRLQTGVQSAETYAALLMENEVAQTVIDRLKLKTTPGTLLSGVTVKPITDTSILRVSVVWKTPEGSAAIANALAEAFVDRERRLVSSSADSALRFTSQQLPSAAARMRVADAALARFETEHHIADLNSETQSLIGSMATLSSRISAVEVDQRQNQAQLETDSGQLSTMQPTSNNGGSTSPNPIYANLESQLSAVDVQLQTAREQYTDEHPIVVNLRTQEQKLRAQLARTPQIIVASTMTQANPVYTTLKQQAANARTAISGDSAQISELRGQLARLQPELRRLPERANRLAELRTAATSAEDVYNTLNKKANDALISKSTALSDVTVLSPASAADAVKKPSLFMNLVVGIVVGAVLAFAGVFLLDIFDNSIKDERDIESLSLPVLASIPRLDAKGKFALPWVRSLTIEAFLQLVTALRYSTDRPITTLAFASPLQGDGKSTIAMNTAIALAEVSPRILIIDADLRRPSLHTKFEIANDFGLSDVLVGNATLDSVTRATRHAGLDLVTSGTRTPNPYKLLQSDRFDTFIEQALKVYRMVIIDGPALNPVIDGAVLCKKASATVLVVSAGATDLRSTKRALQRLQSVGVRDILGIVVNRTSPRRQDYNEYYLGGGTAGTSALALPMQQ